MAWLAMAGASEVTLDGTRYLSMLPPVAEVEKAPRLRAQSRELHLREVGDDLLIDATYQLPASDRTELLMLGRVELESVRPALPAVREGVFTFLVVPPGPAREVSFRARAPFVDDIARVALPTATRGTATAEGLRVPQMIQAGGEWVGTQTHLDVSREPPPPAGQRVVLAECSVGVTVGEQAVQVASRLQWTASTGELETVSFRAPGAGADLVVDGLPHERQGDRVVVSLPVGVPVVSLNVRYSVATVSEGKMPLPMVFPEGAFRTQTTLQLARNTDYEILPELNGWESMTTRGATDLIRGTPIATFSATNPSGGSLQILDFQPVAGPATLVDVASLTAALTDEGRMLVRGLYSVRNDRGAFLEITAPEGLKMIGARVSGETASVSRKEGRWIVPLAKSVETVDGLLSFPVEVTFLGDTPDWKKRESRALPLPVVSAEVAVTRVSVYLPEGYESRFEAGEARIVEDFTEGNGLTYGFAVGDVRAVEAEEVFQEAVGAWLSNDFDTAQENLDKLGSLGADNSNIDRLQQNLFLVQDESKVEASESIKRRVKAQAQARAFEEERAAEEALEIARNAEAEGSYKVAEDNYRAALNIQSRLELLSTDEDQRTSVSNSKLQAKLKDLESRKKDVGGKNAGRKQAMEKDGLAPSPGVPEVSATIVVQPSPAEELLGEAQRVEDSPTPEPVQDVVVVDEKEVLVESTSGAKVLSKEFLQKIPTGRSYQQAVNMAAGVTGGGATDGKKKEAKKKSLPKGKRADAPSMAALDDTITATTLSVEVPTHGELIRYQQMLLAPNQQPDVVVFAKDRRTRRIR